MVKKILVVGSSLLIVSAALGVVLLLGLGKEDPLVTRAKEEVRQTQAAFDIFQNTVYAIPILELSQDIKNDFKIQTNYLGAMGYIVPDVEEQPRAVMYIEKMAAASESRGSSRFHIDLDEGLGKISENLVEASEVTAEDLDNLEKLANTFDVQVKQAKSAIPQLTPLTVERNKRTEKYFLEFERIRQKMDALVATLDGYSSTDLREKIETLRQANELFGGIAAYTTALIGGRTFGYPLDISKLFPGIKTEEARVKECVSQPRLAGCRPPGPFPGGYQSMLQKLEPLYNMLIEG